MARSAWSRGKAPARSQNSQPEQHNNETKQQTSGLQKAKAGAKTALKPPTKGAGELFEGVQFYLSLTLTAARRKELRDLIVQNGGSVQSSPAQCIELVERAHLQPDKNWFAADFVEDSIRDGALKEFDDYMAPTQGDSAAGSGAQRKVHHRKGYSLQEQAKMLKYLRDNHPDFYGKASVPMRIWQRAETKKLLPGRTHQSMHEHSKKKLARLTKKERDAILERVNLYSDKSEGEGDGCSSQPVEASASIVNDGDATESDGERDARPAKRQKRAARENARVSDADLPDTTHNEEQDDEIPPPSSPIPGEAPTDGAPVEDVQQEESRRSGEVFRSYWEQTAADPLRRRQLDRYFVPPPNSREEVVEQATQLSGTPSAYRTPQRSRRLSNGSATPTPQDRRRDRRSSTEQSSTPRTPAQAAQDQLLSVLEDMVGQRMTPPRRQSLDRLIPVSQATSAEADQVLKQLELETGHDLNTVCSAMYWASGDPKTAKDFLLGYLPSEMWSPEEDRLLVDYMHEEITEAELAAARRQGKFEGIRGKRNVRDLLRRIQFLL